CASTCPLARIGTVTTVVASPSDPPTWPPCCVACSARRHRHGPAPTEVCMSTVVPYAPEPFTDFGQEANRRAYQAALAALEPRLGADWPLVIGADRFFTERKIDSLDPCEPGRVVGRAS